MVTEAPTAAAAELEATLEALAEVCEDLAPVVYARFFEAHPEAPFPMPSSRPHPKAPVPLPSSRP